ncbi:hypothetical protein Dsin_031874 [Dipteronia sinensis]|uniref:Uncharacterized protein n=1 Tax=Dipteronia sinensis TaxID=43782 RepID=A0AAD9ZMT2_9ROSI|nr:hypothetical protein Dsin_031874 [Dipteronia sinensis]
MKQKLVIKVSMDGHKSRPKVMKLVVGAYGVESAGWKGDDKSQIEVTGEGLDPAVLTQLLRKKVGHADLVSFGPAGGEDKKENDAKLEVTAMPASYVSWPNCEVVQVVRDPYYEQNSCSIM